MKKIIIVALIVGFVITLITGLIRTTPQDLVGATWYGWPLAWRIVPVVLQPQTSYNIGEFIADVIIWFIVVFVILVLLTKLKNR